VQHHAELLAKIRECASCGLCALPAKAMPAGDVKNQIMLIGNWAGPQDLIEDRPLTGPAGEFLDRMLIMAAQKINPRWARNQLYVTNVVKGVPLTDDKRRAAAIDEIAQCQCWLQQEIDLVKPKLLVCLGLTPARLLISPDFTAEDYGKVFGDELKKIAMPHPLDVLALGETTKEGKAAKNECWKILQQANTLMEEV
jgi:uracil-DNA glycosylase family 4